MVGRYPLRRLFVGLIFGDEGKGKVVDEEVTDAVGSVEMGDGKRVIVARFQGTNNAGHSIYVRNKEGDLVKFVTHMTPSGIVRGTDIAIGPSVALNTLAFVSELEGAEKLFGYDGRVLISNRTGLLFEYHQSIDKFREGNGNGVGSTRQGAGPFYEDVARRTTRITFADYLSDRFNARLKNVLNEKKLELEAVGIIDLQAFHEKIYSDHERVRERLKGTGVELEYRMRDYLVNEDHIIIEGAQGTGLDVDMGDLPNITSSHLLAPHAFATLGLPRTKFRVTGVAKIYATRVGKGKLPTEDPNLAPLGEYAGEVGATTGRVRTMGQPDWVLAKRAAMLNNCDDIILTRADCVQDVELRPCVAYRVNGILTKEVPCSLDVVKPEYSGTSYKWKLWDGDRNLADPLAVDEKLRPIRAQYLKGGFKGLPGSLQQFIKDHDEFVGCRTTGLSIGPACGETVRF